MQTVDDFRKRAKEALPRAVFDHLDGGVEDETTVSANSQSIERIRLIQRVLTGVDECDLTTGLLGAELKAPLFLAPTGHHQLAHRDGEVATAQAAARAGILMILSTASSMPLEEVRDAASCPMWFQLFPMRDHAITRDLAHRAAAAGYTAVVVTVDTQRMGNFARNRNTDSHFFTSMREGNFEKYEKAQTLGDLFAGEATYKFIEDLAEQLDIPVVVKGIQCPEDALASIDAGAAAIYVSNHGGRQLDSGVGALDLLPPIAGAVGDRCPILIDGGFRRGTDVIKALALGATAVGFGRPYLYGLASDGSEGVFSVVDSFVTELGRDLILMGSPSPDSLDASWTRQESTRV